MAAQWIRRVATGSIFAVAARRMHFTIAENAEPTGNAEESAEADSRPCLHMTLHEASAKEVLSRFPSSRERELADRVLIRSCIVEETSTHPVRVLAYAQDSWSQSLLVSVGSRLWAAGVIPETGMGYAVVPISLNLKETMASAAAKDVGSTETPASPTDAEDKGVEPSAGKSALPKAEAGAPVAASESNSQSDQEVEMVTPWDIAEGLWQRLEAAGILVVERDEFSMPSAVRLANGGQKWSGDLPSEFIRTDQVEVRLVDDWTLSAQTAKPECGFCKFMKAGPCGEVFTVR
uniref:Uncharacterized protein n=1 Tax=Chrysotila carterae TaxID=13221 RepID=A0A7S4B643_CHRCT